MNEHDRDVLLARLDERTKKIEEDVESLKRDDRFVTKAEFAPVKAVVYGMVGALLLAVLGSLVALVVK